MIYTHVVIIGNLWDELDSCCEQQEYNIRDCTYNTYFSVTVPNLKGKIGDELLVSSVCAASVSSGEPFIDSFSESTPVNFAGTEIECVNLVFKLPTTDTVFSTSFSSESFSWELLSVDCSLIVAVLCDRFGFGFRCLITGLLEEASPSRLMMDARFFLDLGIPVGRSFGFA